MAFRQVIKHEGATWHSNGRVVWVDSQRAAWEVRDLLIEEGYTLYDAEVHEPYFYVFVFMLGRPQDYSRVRPGELLLCYRMLLDHKLHREVVYRYDEGKPWNVFSGSTNGNNASNLELCSAVNPGAIIKTRPSLGETFRP